MKLNPPAGTHMRASSLTLAVSSRSPATMSFCCSMYAMIAAYASGSSAPGAGEGMRVRMTLKRLSAVLPPYFAMNSAPLSGGASGPSFKFAPWHGRQSGS